MRDFVAAARELWGWAVEHRWILFLGSVAAYAQQHYDLYGPPAHLYVLPGLAVAMFLVFPLWAVILCDSDDRIAWGLAGAGCAAALAPALAWAYADGWDKALRADPTWLVVGAGLGLALVVAAAIRGRVSLGAWGLGPGDLAWWGPKVGLIVAGMVVVIPLVAWIEPSYVEFYPRYKPGRTDPIALVQYQLAMAIYMFAWEFLFRGFMLNGFARWIGPLGAILAQCYPFFVLHHTKPESEMVLSWFGGLVIGWFCWRSRSMWPGALLHSVQYSVMEISAFLLRP